MKKIWAKYKTDIVVISYLAAFLASIYFVFIPAIFRTKGISDEIQKRIIDQQLEEARKGSLPQMKDELKKYTDQKESLNVILASGNEASFIESLESMAASTGNSVSLKIPDSSSATGAKSSSSSNKNKTSILSGLAYKTYFPMEIDLKGNYPGLISFLHNLENMKFYANVISLSIKKNIDTKSQPAGSSDVFSDSSGTPNPPKESEILNSTLNIIVYTKK